MSRDILWPLIAGLGASVYLAYRVRSARQGKEISMRSVSFFMLFLTFSIAWLFLIVMPVVALIIWFAPGLFIGRSWLFLVIFTTAALAASALTLAPTLRKLWPPGT